MPENSLQSLLLEAFPKSNKEIWEQTASRETEGKQPYDILSWKSSDGINFFPYYESADVTHLGYLKKFRLTADENSFLGSRRWWCMPRVSVDDPKQSNKISLDHLAAGADGIIFYIQSSPDPHILLENIEWPYCALSFQSADDRFLIKELPAYISKNNFDPDSLTGTLFWESSPKKGDINFYLEKTPRLKSLGIIIQPTLPVIEIAEALAKGVRLIEKLKESDIVPHQLFSAVAFSLTVDPSFFVSMAKLKALRMLWYQIAQAYAVKNFYPADLHIHALSLPWTKTEYEPHGSLIKSTTASMAAILGGCDFLTIVPQDEQNPTFSRIARNVSSILREESHFNKVADPVAGSYAVDAITDALAKNAWTLFQSKLNS